MFRRNNASFRKVQKIIMNLDRAINYVKLKISDLQNQLEHSKYNDYVKVKPKSEIKYDLDNLKNVLDCLERVNNND